MTKNKNIPYRKYSIKSIYSVTSTFVASNSLYSNNFKSIIRYSPSRGSIINLNILLYQLLEI